MKRLFALVMLLLAVTQTMAATWTNGTQVVENIIWTPGYRGFYVSAATYHDPETCAGVSNRLYLIDPTLDEKTVDRLYAMLLTAWATGNTIFVWVNGCHPYPAPKFSGLQINK